MINGLIKQHEGPSEFSERLFKNFRPARLDITSEGALAEIWNNLGKLVSLLGTLEEFYEYIIATIQCQSETYLVPRSA